MRPFFPLISKGFQHSRQFSKAPWPNNSLGETDRHPGWRNSNWGGNVVWGGCEIIEPTSIGELQSIVAYSPKVRVIGSAYSCAPIVYSSDPEKPTLISLRRAPRTWSLDEKKKTVTVDAGTTYSELCHGLNNTKFALPNTAAISHIQIGGAIATASHGSSGKARDGRLTRSGLADAVMGLEIVGPDGTIRNIHKGHPQFTSSVVSLGMVGVVTRVTLSLVDDYDVIQRVHGAWPPTPTGTLGKLLSTLPQVMSQADSFSAFVKWNVDDFGVLVSRKQVPRGSKDSSPQRPLTAQKLLTEPIKEFLGGGDFQTTGVGRWHEKMHLWMNNGSQFVAQPHLQIAHFVPIQFAERALRATRSLASRWGNEVLYCELGAVRGDNHLLSPYSADAPNSPDSLSISHSFDGSLSAEKVMQRAAELEFVLRPFYARPHWGKLSAMTAADLRDLYGPRLKRFQEVQQQVDPNRKFTNGFLGGLLLD